MFSNLARKLDWFTEEEEALTPEEIVRAWEDPSYRARLSPRQIADLPAHPAGVGRLLRLVEDPYMNSSNHCSSDNCSSSNCSSNNCSSSNCSSDNCSSSNCSSNNCSSNNCFAPG